MKKSVKGLVLILLALSAMFSSVAFASGEIKVSIDGQYVDFDVNPQIINDRTMVPMRKIFEYLGAEVDWNHDTKGITAVKDDVNIRMQIDVCDMYVNDEKITLDVAPVIADSRTLVPVRAISEALDACVGWESDIKTVRILTNVSDIPKKAQGVWQYLYIEQDGVVIPKDETTGMEIFRKDFTITINGIDAHISADGYSAMGHFECNDGVYIIMGMNPSFESNIMKLYNAKQNVSIVFAKTNKKPILKESKKVHEDKDWVYDVEKFEDRYVDGVGNDCHYTYQVPAFNISSEDAQSLNSQIYSYIYNYYQETIQQQKNEESLFIHKIKNVYYVNDDIVSLGVKVLADWDTTYNKWYNINKSTGKKVSNSELVSLLGYSDVDFIKHLKDVVATYYVNLWKDNNPEGQNEYYWDRYNYTISDEACNMNIPMYIGENGNLYVVAKIGSLAGAGHYEHLIDTGIKACHSAPTFTVGRAIDCITIWQNANASLSWLYPLHDNDTIEVVVSEEYSYSEIAKRVMGAETREDVKNYILEYVTKEAEAKYGVTNVTFEMGGVERNGKLYAYMPGYGPEYFAMDTAKQIDDIDGYKCVSVIEDHHEEPYVFCFAIEGDSWKIADVIEPSR